MASIFLNKQAVMFWICLLLSASAIVYVFAFAKWIVVLATA